jgi:hypothetical protein
MSELPPYNINSPNTNVISDEDIVHGYPLQMDMDKLLSNLSTDRQKSLNAFMLYRRNKMNSPEFKNRPAKDKQASSVSIEIAKQWKEEPESVKEIFYALARMAKKKHAETYRQNENENQSYISGNGNTNHVSENVNDSPTENFDLNYASGLSNGTLTGSSFDPETYGNYETNGNHETYGVQQQTENDVDVFMTESSENENNSLAFGFPQPSQILSTSVVPNCVYPSSYPLIDQQYSVYFVGHNTGQVNFFGVFDITTEPEHIEYSSYP